MAAVQMPAADKCCCPPLSFSALSTPNFPLRGSIVALARGARAYITQPSKPEQAREDAEMLVYPDIFGIESGRTRHVCDALADELNCSVVMPDMYCSEPFVGMPGTDEMRAWLAKHDWAPDGKIASEELLVRSKASKIVIVGFCAGAWNFLHLLKDLETMELPERKEIVSCVGVHPSVQLEGVFKRSPSDLVRNAVETKLCSKFLWINTDDEPADITKNGEWQRILRDGCVESQIIARAAGIRHGFVTRGDTEKDTVVRAAVEAAMDEIVKYTQAALQ